MSRTTPSPPDIGGHHGFQRVKLTKQCIFSEALIFYLRENIYFPGINRHFDRLNYNFCVEICPLCALNLPLFEGSIKAFHEIFCVKNGPTLLHSTEDISGTDRATDTIFFALKSEEYFPAEEIAINCSSIVLLIPPDLPTRGSFA